MRKQLDRLDAHCRAFIAASPLIMIGTQSAGAFVALVRADLWNPAKYASPRTVPRQRSID